MLFNSLLAFALLAESFAAPLTSHRAPIKRSITPNARAVASDAYIVSIKDNTVDPANRGAWLNRVLDTAGVSMTSGTSNLRLGWNETLMNGIAGTFSAKALEAIRSQPEVAFIEPDYQMSISAIVQQSNAPWGVSRVSTGQVALKGLDPLGLQFPFFSDSTGGAGTDVYVLDTGIRATHAEFGGRATFLKTFGPGVPGVDVNGHGTHVSGTAVGKTVGIAKQANVLMIKVVADDGSAATSDIISGINLATQRAAANPTRPAVVNMSLGGPVSNSLDAAVSAAVAQGLPFCVAAGNETQDANNSSPARLPEVITVGATDINDKIASFSNFGNKVDVFAPGDTIISASNKDDASGAVLSGTSMASPHIAGLSALVMGQSGKLSPAALSAKITSLGVAGVISGIPAGTTNTLAFDGALDATQIQAALAALGQGTAAGATSSAAAAVSSPAAAVPSPAPAIPSPVAAPATGGNGKGGRGRNGNAA